MRHCLIIVRTPFQLITAILLAQNKLRGAVVDLLVVSSFNASEDISKKCTEINLFGQVFYYDYSKLNYTMGVIFPQIAVSQLGFGKSDTYDDIYTNSLYGDLEFSLLYYMPRATVFLYDEGYSSYIDTGLEYKLSTKHSLCRAISSFMFKRPNIVEAVNQHLLYDRDLIVRAMPFPTAPIWTKNEAGTKSLMQTVSNVFYVKKVIQEYDRKFIYFEECFANDFNNNGDLQIINVVAAIVGKENLMIKLHPRDKTNRFEQAGIKTNTYLQTPTEALLSEMESKDAVFISFTSGSTINYKFLCDYNIRTILLYKLFPEAYVKMSQMQIEWFDKFINKYNKNIYAPSSLPELEEILKNI